MQYGPLHPQYATLEASANLCGRKSTFFTVVYKICAAYILFKHQKTSQVPGEFMTMMNEVANIQSSWTMNALAQSTVKKYPTLLQFHNSPTILEATAEWCLMTNTWVVSTWSNMAHWHSTTHSAFPLMLWSDPLTITLWCQHQLGCCNNAPGIPREIQEVW